MSPHDGGMRGILIGSCLGVGWLAVSFFTENLFPLGDWRWGITAVLFFSAAAVVWLWPKKQRETQAPKQARKFSDFDMPIETAIDHIVDSTHHSFTRSSLAERNAFEQLHKAMCAGLLPVIGKRGVSAVPRKISPRRCKKLQRREMATPHGMRFHLTEKRPFKKVTDGLKKDSPVLVKQDDLFGFGELRVRSKDLYATWPLNLEEGGEA